MLPFELQELHIAAALAGILLILHGSMKLASKRYYRAIYETPLMGGQSTSDKAHQANSYWWWRYAMSVKEFGLGLVLLAWAMGLF